MGEERTRRELMRDVGVAAGGLAALGLAPSSAEAADAKLSAVKPYTLPPLPYGYDALEPHLDKQTLTLHHDKHHAGYVGGLNAALKKLADARATGTSAMDKYWTHDAAFHGSGHALHTLYWGSMKPGGGGKPAGKLATMIDRDFGSHDAFAAQFTAVTTSVAGSGWGVLAFESLGRRLLIMGVEKHENVATSGALPLMVCDVWEHAYYLKYQNRRADYVKAFVEHLVDWEAVGRRLLALYG